MARTLLKRKVRASSNADEEYKEGGGSCHVSLKGLAAGVLVSLALWRHRRLTLNSAPFTTFSLDHLPTTTNDKDIQSSSPCLDYVAYPQPEHGQGLPYLHDVFASPDKEWIWFVGMNRGVCEPSWAESDNFMDRESRFVCMFPHQVPVISEAVAPTGGAFKGCFLFRCKIPPQYQPLLIPGQTSTSLHIDLHSLSNPEAPPVGISKIRPFPSQPISETPKLSHLAICHPGKIPNKPYNLVAFTRVLASGEAGVQNHWKSIAPGLTQWMDYHLSQGFDHFVLYDHGKDYHNRPIENLTRPYVEAGLVTYRWWPLEDCKKNQPGHPLHGFQIRIGQQSGGLAAMHRLGLQGATYMAHMDVDEFFVIYNNQQTILEYTQHTLTGDLDALQFEPTVLGFCNGVTVDSPLDSNLEKRQCSTPHHQSDVKLIMRMDRMLHYNVHYALTTRNWTKPKTLKVNNETVGFLAHLRGPMTTGTKATKFTKRVTQFDSFLQDHKAAQASGVPYFEKFARDRRGT